MINRIFSAALLIFALAGTTAGNGSTAVYNSIAEVYGAGASGVSMRNDNRNNLIKTIDGNYSKFKISNKDDALRSVEQIKKLIGIKDPAEELVFARSQETGFDGEIVYDFDQYYKGIPVRYASVRIIVDGSGYPNWFTSSIVPEISLDAVTPKISKDEMYKIVGEMDVEEVCKDMKLCIAVDEKNGNKPTLAYSVTVYAMTGIWNDPDKKMLMDYEYILNADTGELIRRNQLTIVD